MSKKYKNPLKITLEMHDAQISIKGEERDANICMNQFLAGRTIFEGNFDDLLEIHMIQDTETAKMGEKIIVSRGEAARQIAKGNASPWGKVVTTP
ncbi:MAG: hypothetical protein OT477_14730 [Chloroflexi bacterium]|nr:hypothetical protein [Chloroflexota bacterium]